MCAIRRRVRRGNGVSILHGALSSDHVHMFVSVPPKAAISDPVRRMEARPSVPPHFEIRECPSIVRVDAAAVTSVAASPVTSVVVPDVEHHMLARIDLQGDDESVFGVVPDRIVIRRRHKVTLVWRARGQDSAHRVRGKCGRVNPS